MSLSVRSAPSLSGSILHMQAHTHSKVSSPSLVPPHCLKASSLQGSHDDVYIVVPVSQHVLLVRRHSQSAGGESDRKKQQVNNGIPESPSSSLSVVPSGSPLVDVLQCVPAERRPVLEDVVEGVQGAELPPLLLMVDGRGAH